MIASDLSKLEQRRIRYALRGPEWAFAVPQGDLNALSEVMRFAVRIWNGANAIIVPVDRRGRIPDEFVSHLLEVRPVELIPAHSMLSDSLRASLTQFGTAVGRLDLRILRRELDPLTLITEPISPQDAIADLHLGLRSHRLSRIQLAAWGDVSDIDSPAWNRLYRMRDAQEDPNPLAGLAHAQISGRSPLAATTRHMRAYEHGGASYERYLWVFDRASFNDIVNFWNCRARLASWYVGTVMLGVPPEALRDTETMDLIAEWVTAPRGWWSKPDLVVCAAERDHVAVRDALTARGFVETHGSSISHGFPAPNPQRPEPEFQVSGPLLGGPLRRGLIGAVEANFINHASRIVFDAPTDFAGGGPDKIIRVEFDDLPFDLPLTDRLAKEAHHAGTAYQGRLLLGVDASQRSWSLDFRVPTGWDALTLWAEGYGFNVLPSQAGRYGQALLDRFDDLGSLDVLSSENAVSVLDQLVSLSTKKLARELVARASGVAQLDEARLVSLLAATPIWTELRTRTLGDIASDAKKRKKELAATAAGLVERGLILRGRALRCPTCNYAQWFSLADLDERLRCQACRARFVLPVVEQDGSEPPTSFRLDGLMARCMDQDLLGVLLTLRWLSINHLRAGTKHAWPGLLFRRGDDEREVDLLAGNEECVFIVEHKRSAAALDLDETRKLLQLAEQLHAVPVLAALTGTVDPAIRQLCEEASGLVAERRELLNT